MSRKLDDLSDRFRPLAMELIARCVEAGVMVMIVDTKRTLAEQQANVAKGVSWTMASRHLTGDAIDVCPFETWNAHGPDKLNWNGDDPVWKQIGAIGESIGLKWGVIKNGKQVDPGHFQLRET